MKLILTTDRVLSVEQRQKLQTVIAEVFPEDRGLILDGGFKAQIVPLTRREQFSMAAMQALLTTFSCHEDEGRRQLAIEAVAYAAALEAALA